MILESAGGGGLTPPPDPPLTYHITIKELGWKLYTFYVFNILMSFVEANI